MCPLPLLVVCEMARRGETPGRCRNAGHTDRHPGAGTGRSGYLIDHDAEQGWSSRDAHLTQSTGASSVVE